MRICLVAESYPPALGGAEFSLQSIVTGLVARGHEVWVVTSSWERHPSSEESSGNLRISRIKTPSVLHRFWFILLALPTVLRSASWADIVQGSTFAGGPLAFVGALLARKKKALLVHEVFGGRWFHYEPNIIRALFYVTMEWIIVRMPFDRYIAPSRATQQALHALGVKESKTSVIYHGDSRLEQPELSSVETRKRLGFQQEDFLFIAFGRVGVTKGFEYLIDAIPEILERAPNARFVLVLSMYDKRLAARIHESIARLPSHVCRLLPPQTGGMLANFVEASDCIVVPSLSEGFGFSALEACNAGKIVVATKGGSLPEVVFGRHVLVEPKSTGALAEGCIRASQGKFEVTPRKEFSWEKTVAEYERLYKSLPR